MEANQDTGEETFSFTRMIDLSVGIEGDAVHEPLKPKIEYQTHENEGGEILARMFGVDKEDFAGIECECRQIEKLANLDEIPRPFGFKVSCLPTKIRGGSGGWCRAVAFV